MCSCQWAHAADLTDQGLKVMVDSPSPGGGDADQYFIFLNPERVRHPGLDPGKLSSASSPGTW